MPHVIFILLRIAWICLVIVSATITMFLFAFADSPRLGKIAGKLFWPVVIGGVIAFGIGARLIASPGPWWHILIAYALAILPPIVVLLFYRWIP